MSFQEAVWISTEAEHDVDSDGPREVHAWRGSASPAEACSDAICDASADAMCIEVSVAEQPGPAMEEVPVHASAGAPTSVEAPISVESWMSHAQQMLQRQTLRKRRTAGISGRNGGDAIQLVHRLVYERLAVSEACLSRSRRPDAVEAPEARKDRQPGGKHEDGSHADFPAAGVSALRRCMPSMLRHGEQMHAAIGIGSVMLRDLGEHVGASLGKKLGAKGKPENRTILRLRCGAVHEICGLCGAGEASTDRSAAPSASDACAQEGDCRQTLATIAPLGCVLCMLQSWNGSSFGAMPSSGDGWSSVDIRAQALVQRGVLWIGNRVHPDAHALWRLDAVGVPQTTDFQNPDMQSCTAPRGRSPSVPAKRVASVAARSVFLRDDLPHEESAVWRAAAHAGRRTGRRSSDDDAARTRMACRVWCAEQALRLGAAGIIVVDGAAFDALAWRRLQLAVQQASADVQGFPPIVLVLTTPDASGELKRRGCAAETRWAVHTDLPEYKRPSETVAASCRSFPGSPSSGSPSLGINLRTPAGVPSWRMRLVSARSLDMAAVCGEDAWESEVDAGAIHAAGDRETSHMRALLEQGALQCVLREAPAVEEFDGVIGAVCRGAVATDLEQLTFRMPCGQLDPDGAAASALRARSA